MMVLELHAVCGTPIAIQGVCSLSGKHRRRADLCFDAADRSPLHGLVAAGHERSSYGNPDWIGVGGLHLYHESDVYRVGLAGSGHCQAERSDPYAGDAVRKLKALQPSPVGASRCGAVLAAQD
jgi:hypothetical protein